MHVEHHKGGLFSKHGGNTNAHFITEEIEVFPISANLLL